MWRRRARGTRAPPFFLLRKLLFSCPSLHALMAGAAGAQALCGPSDEVDGGAQEHQRLMFQWRVFTSVKWNILFPQGVCLALVVPSGSQSWTIITLGKRCLSGFGSALRVPKVNTHHPRGKNLWLKSMIPFFETKNVLRALYWGFNKIPI